jgi:hypothetical protein
MAPLPNCSLCFSHAIAYVIKQRKQLVGGAIADGEADAKNLYMHDACSRRILNDVQHLN